MHCAAACDLDHHTDCKDFQDTSGQGVPSGTYQTQEAVFFWGESRPRETALPITKTLVVDRAAGTVRMSYVKDGRAISEVYRIRSIDQRPGK